MTDETPTRPAGQTISVPGAPPPTEALRRLGRYEVLELIGAGGMGLVYRGRDPALDRIVAIKLVQTEGDPDDAARLLREARALAKVEHANVVPIYDVEVSGEQIYLVMPLLSGGTLRSWLRAAPRTWREIVARYVEAGRGLCAAHAAGLVHRDFKPDNVLLDEAGGVFVADFGLARPSFEPPQPGTTTGGPPQATRRGAVAGTPKYMAPEQLAGAPLDGRCDQFALAVALWEALFDMHPFGLVASADELTSAELVRRIAAGASTPGRRDVPPRLVAALRRALATTPDVRWPTLAALLDELAGLARPRRKLVWIAGATALLAVVTTVSLAVMHGSKTPGSGPVTPPTAKPGEAVPRLAGSDGTQQFTVAASYDPLRFEPIAFLPEARRLARQLFADAELTMLELPFTYPDGHIDLTPVSRYDSLAYYFGTPSVKPHPAGPPYLACRVVVWIWPDRVTVSSLVDSTGTSCDQPTVSPRCSIAEIWRRALAEHVSTGTVARLQFSQPRLDLNEPPLPVRWLMTDLHGDSHTFADDCP